MSLPLKKSRQRSTPRPRGPGPPSDSHPASLGRFPLQQIGLGKRDGCCRSNRALKQTTSYAAQTRRGLPVLWPPSRPQLYFTSPWHLHLWWLHTVEFQGEANRKPWPLPPLSAGQRPCAEEQSIVLSYPTSLLCSACTSLRTRLSLHTGLPITSHGRCFQSPCPSFSCFKELLPREGPVCHSQKRKLASPRLCATARYLHNFFLLTLQKTTASCLLAFGQYYTKGEGKWLLTAGLTQPSPPGDLNPSLFWPVCPGKKSTCKRDVC